MRRVVSVYLPTWATDRWRRKNAASAPGWDNPLVTVVQEGPRRVLASVDREGDVLCLHVGRSQRAHD